jgi:hypothetical protein
MTDTATAVASAITDATGLDAPAAAPAPTVVRREDVRDRIMARDWHEDTPETPAAPAAVDDAEGMTDAPELEAPAAEPEAPASDEPPPSELEGDATGEPPAEAVIGEGGNRVVVRSTDGTYLKTPAELVRMARDGVAGQQFAQEVKEYREQIPQVVERFKSLEQELEAQRALNLELLSDEGRYRERKYEWDQLNSPEQRLARYEREREEELYQRRATEQEARQRDVVLQYYTQEVKPVQDDLFTKFPQVALEAKMGRIALDTASMLVNGVIPPNRLPEYKAYLEGPFREWVQAESAKVESVQRQREARIDTQRRQAQANVQTVGRKLAPTGKAAPDVPPPAPKPRNREEAKRFILDRAWQD